MEKIAILTSGGDSPGMNSCIRAVVRSAIYKGLKMVGIKRGFSGLIEEDVEELCSHSVSGIIRQGGTVLKTARSEAFKTVEGQKKAVETIKSLGIEGLIVIGGNGSLRGGYTLDRDWDIPVIGVPASIDNDIAGTDFSIGCMTAVNTALEAIDRIRDTATSHNRLFIIEVMGRSSGFIALWAGLAGGAEDVLIPEMKTNLNEVCRKLEKGRLHGKSSSILIVAEGDKAGGAFEIGEKIKKKIGYEIRVVVLGHLQRGGSPVALDRILAIRLGSAAVDLLIKGERRKMVGLVSSQIKVSPIEYSWEGKKEIDLSLYDFSQIMAI